ncbi:M6 family metalloprotease domain-containing protein [Prevotella dentasini]|uniref:M6 family metalloprotease domain-containing protein n=1 Tax=Prevotella dentasini TaxID=589537 RepID=UPI00046A0DE1|nr:M6 family metalloprotease domain-containing protein [Prevotella dentasini]
MRKFLTLVLLLCAALSTYAVPAKKEWRTFQQSDGTTIQLMLVGDEHLHYYLTMDDKIVVKDNDRFVYALASENGLAPTEILVHDIDLRSSSEKAAVAKLGSQEEGVRRAYAKAQTEVHPRSKLGEPIPNLNGDKKGLVILISFADNDFTIENPREQFLDMCNTVGYSKHGAVGSVHDYFSDSSNGALNLTFDVVGPYKAAYNMSFYGKNNDYNVRTLIKEAVRKAYADGLDFTPYDWDEDGFVDQVYVVYAGYNEAQGAPEYTIWPHESVLGYGTGYDNTVTVGNKRVNTYACGSELAGSGSGSTPRLDGLGTLCHEYSHCLGLPDFYDTSYKSKGADKANYGMFVWDIMDQGPYNGNGFLPPAYTGYERNFCGWLTYRELDPSKPCKVEGMKSVAAGGEVYQIKNPYNDSEYFLLETREASTKWDKGLKDFLQFSTAGGMLITHLTYVPSRFSTNKVNAGSSYQCFTPVLADNDPNNRYKNGGMLNPGGIRTDLWGTANHFELSTTTTPAFDFNLSELGTFNGHLTEITFKNKQCSFVWMGGTQSWEEANPAGIAGVNVLTVKDEKVYNLNGQYVGTSLDGLQKGIYIQNGKKVVVK